MTGGPWTRSMKVVHGPGPKWGSMDPWSMFCPHPVGTLCKASCEEFVFGDQRLCNWILLASNSGTLYSFCE